MHYIKSYSIYLLAFFILAGCSAQTVPLASKAQEMSNVDKAAAIVEGIGTGSSKVLDYISAVEYIQHNLSYADGKSAVVPFFQGKPSGVDITVHRVLEDGDYIIVHSTYGGVWNNNQPQVVFDVFRFKDGLAVEHWDDLRDVAPPNLSGHTETDGPTQPTNLDKTEANKAFTKEFVNTVLVQADYSGLDQFFDGNNYINHSPGVADGLTGLNDALAGMAKAGVTMEYDIIHKVIGEGDLILAMSEGSLGGKHTAFYDMFRVQDGKIAEHWDVVADIPAESEWKNSNGKF